MTELANYAERALWTAVQTFISVLALDALLIDGDIGALSVAAASALSGALSVLKEFAKKRRKALKKELE